MATSLTGLSLTITEPARELENSAFRVKMLMVLMLVGTIWLNHSRLNTDPDYWTVSGPRRRAARALGIASLGLGAGIVMAGRWIAYV